MLCCYQAVRSCCVTVTACCCCSNSCLHLWPDHGFGIAFVNVSPRSAEVCCMLYGCSRITWTMPCQHQSFRVLHLFVQTQVAMQFLQAVGNGCCVWHIPACSCLEHPLLSVPLVMMTLSCCFKMLQRSCSFNTFPRCCCWTAPSVHCIPHGVMDGCLCLAVKVSASCSSS